MKNVIDITRRSTKAQLKDQTDKKSHEKKGRGRSAGARYDRKAQRDPPAGARKVRRTLLTEFISAFVFGAA